MNESKFNLNINPSYWSRVGSNRVFDAPIHEQTRFNHFRLLNFINFTFSKLFMVFQNLGPLKELVSMFMTSSKLRYITCVYTTGNAA